MGNFDRVEKFFAGNPEFDTLVSVNGDASLGTNATFRYYARTTIDDSIFVAKKGDVPTLIVPAMHEEQAKIKFDGNVIAAQVHDHPLRFRDFVSSSKRIAIAGNEISHADFENLMKTGLDRIRFVDASGKFRAQRSVKDEEEIALIKKAAKISRNVMAEVEKEFCEGKTEIEIENEILIGLMRAGAGPSFRPIIAFGANSRFPHHNSGETKLKRGDIILIDWGAKCDGYCSDHTRCFFFGENPEAKKAYEIARNLFYELTEGIKPGVSIADTYLLFTKRIVEEGLTVPAHSLGHGIGLEVHEGRIRDTNPEKFEEGNVIAVEPASYTDKFGVRFEETLVVRKKAEII